MSLSSGRYTKVELAWFEFTDRLKTEKQELQDAILELQRFEEEVACPWCSEWNHVTALPDETVTVKCIGCGKRFTAELVQYLSVGDFDE